MMDRCQAWINISDRVLLNERVTSAERAFLREHEAVCKTCAREASAWSDLRPTALYSVPDPDEVEAVIESAAVTTPNHPAFAIMASKPPWLRRAAAALAAAVALVAAAMFLRPGADDADAASETSSRRVAPAVLGATATPRGVVASAEDTCGEVADGVTVCVTAGSEIPTVALDTARPSLALKRGRVIASLECRAMRTSFGIITEKGSVAGGPLFSVEVAEDGAVTARVLRGNVLVQGAAGERGHALLAGQLLRLGERYSLRLTDDDRERDLSLLERFAPAAFIRQYTSAFGERGSGRTPASFDPEMLRAQRHDAL
ncbi:MAG TPA: hypothetical protein VFQ35_03600 [Polyangiaceae bacterium]|nr:hypothetical protein [Polyangiaceae bacterium]